MKQQTFRHVCFDFSDGHTIGIRTLDPVEKVKKMVQDPKSWKNGTPRTIIRVWEEWW